MKRFLIKYLKLTMRTIIVLCVATVIFFPYLWIYIFLGKEQAGKMLDKTMNWL